MIAKTMFGIHTDICGGVEPASAKVLNSVKNKMNMNDKKNPTAI